MKGINRSMVCREVASLAKRVERGGIERGSVNRVGSSDGDNGGGESKAGAIQGKYCEITNLNGNDVNLLVFDTEQECIDALRTLTEAILANQCPIIITITDTGASYIQLPTEAYSCMLSQMPGTGDETIPGTDIPLRETMIITVTCNEFRLICSSVVLSQLSYNVNNPNTAIVMTKDYVSANYPTATLRDFTIRFI